MWEPEASAKPTTVCLAVRDVLNLRRLVLRMKPIRAQDAARAAGVNTRLRAAPACSWASRRGQKNALAERPKHFDAAHSRRPTSFAAAPAGKHPHSRPSAKCPHTVLPCPQEGRSHTAPQGPRCASGAPTEHPGKGPWSHLPFPEEGTTCHASGYTGGHRRAPRMPRGHFRPLLPCRRRWCRRRGPRRKWPKRHWPPQADPRFRGRTDFRPPPLGAEHQNPGYKTRIRSAGGLSLSYATAQR